MSFQDLHVIGQMFADLSSGSAIDDALTELWHRELRREAERRADVRADSVRLAAKRKYQREWQKAQRAARPAKADARRKLNVDQLQRAAALLGSASIVSIARVVGVHHCTLRRAIARGEVAHV